MPPGSGDAVIRWMQRRSGNELLERRAAIVDALRDIAPLEFVNGGGTGSLELTASDRAVTELTAGSGLLAGHLFDGYRAFDPAPAAAFALEVVRKPAPDIATVLGGGWIASGPPLASRQPLPVWPPGLKTLARRRGRGADAAAGRVRPRRSRSATGCGSGTPRAASSPSASTATTWSTATGSSARRPPTAAKGRRSCDPSWGHVAELGADRIACARSAWSSPALDRGRAAGGAAAARASGMRSRPSAPDTASPASRSRPACCSISTDLTGLVHVDRERSRVHAPAPGTRLHQMPDAARPLRPRDGEPRRHRPPVDLRRHLDRHPRHRRPVRGHRDPGHRRDAGHGIRRPARRSTRPRTPNCCPPWRSGLGALGILVDVTLQCVPAFVLHAVDRPGGPRPGPRTRSTSVPRSADHFEFYWFPHTDRGDDEDATRACPRAPPRHPLPRVGQWVDDIVVGTGLHQVACDVGKRGAGDDPLDQPRLGASSGAIASSRISRRACSRPSGRSASARWSTRFRPRTSGRRSRRSERSSTSAGGASSSPSRCASPRRTTCGCPPRTAGRRATSPCTATGARTRPSTSRPSSRSCSSYRRAPALGQDAHAGCRDPPGALPAVRRLRRAARSPRPRPHVPESRISSASWVSNALRVGRSALMCGDPRWLG